MKRLAILGSTGSIGTSTLDVVEGYPDRFQIVALAAGANLDRLEAQVRRFAPRLVSVGSEAGARELRRRLGRVPTEVVWGTAGLLQAAADADADLVVSAIVGAGGLLPTMRAVAAGKDVALANKESLVMAGHLLTAEARVRGTRVLPVDSEHSAIFQCLAGNGMGGVRRIVLTASGGPFRTRSRSAMASITPEEALKHPNWSMGQKITIDSATLMNKGLEVIEAHWLFGLPMDQVDVIIHPQSIIHSLVEYVDGSVLAQLGVADMRIPIQYALTYPQRRANRVPRLLLEKLAGLTFEPVDREKFPCLDLAYEAARAGGSSPTVMNAANEIAVHRFLDRRIGFDEIPTLI
ncbi:MAG TPA: 1-deoxy-D-xylulose-5-phosphate reductoisomerase, partial [Candidatus Methylomirabilis sp.]